MRPLADARADVLAVVPKLGDEVVPIGEALDRVTSGDVISEVSVPPFANSAMDGFAVLASDLAGAPVDLEVIEDVRAGSVPTAVVRPGTAIRIMTGAPMPGGADSIAKVEITSMVDDTTVRVHEPVEQGTSVRRAGGDVEPGDVVVGSGVRISPRHLATIASITGRVQVSRQPTVAVLSTGDEIVPPDTATLRPGTIRDTNRVMLVGMLRELGVPVLDLGIVGDDRADLRRAFAQAASAADVIVSTGGVSMGDHDHVKHVLGERGSIHFWKVAMQPAKPFAFGDLDGVPLFGLPGNPVSTFVAFEQFVRPALLHMMGASAILRPRVQGTMGEDVSTSVDKEVFVRVLIADDGGRSVAVLAGGQGSNVLSALAAADAFAVVPVGVGDVSAGDNVILEMFRSAENRTSED
jgi:molybdopterin molybdotransferase